MAKDLVEQSQNHLLLYSESFSTTALTVTPPRNIANNQTKKQTKKRMPPKTISFRPSRQVDVIKQINPLECRGNYTATSQPTQAPPLCTKCNSPPINGQSSNHRISILYNGSLLCGVNVPIKALHLTRSTFGSTHLTDTNRSTNTQTTLTVYN